MKEKELMEKIKVAFKNISNDMKAFDNRLKSIETKLDNIEDWGKGVDQAIEEMFDNKKQDPDPEESSEDFYDNVNEFETEMVEKEKKKQSQKK